jgi:hypothetical protein
MKKSLIALLLSLVILLVTPRGAAAASLGVSPSQISIHISEGSSETINFQVFDFNGIIEVTPIGIPVSIEPASFPISQSPQNVSLSFHSLTEETGNYDGYVRFYGVAGGSVALAVNVKAKVSISLSVTIVPQPSGNTGGGGGPTMGPSLPNTTSSPDGKVNLSLPIGTIMRNAGGQRVYNPTIGIAVNLPPVPEGSCIIGLGYEFGPSGATFTPSIVLTFHYLDSDIPDGVAEGDLTVAYYDTEDGWVELTGCIVDPITNTIIVSVSHFSKYAILADLPVVMPIVPTIPEVSIPTIPTLPEVIPALPEVTPEQPIVPTLPPNNSWKWGILGLATLAIAGGILTYLVRRRKKVA